MIHYIELVFTQAVLMHIFEKEQRLKSALQNIFATTDNFVVLVENWSQQNFLIAIREIQTANSEWSSSHICFTKSEKALLLR